MNFKKFKNMIFSPVGIVFLVYFMQGVIHNLGHPVTPALVSDLGIPDYYFGIFFAAMSFGLLVGAPIWGILADLSQKRYYMFFGLLLYSLGQYLFGFGTNKNLMVLYRFMSGVGVSASITLLMSHLVEHSPKEMRKMFLGWYQGLFVLGSSVGYYFAGVLTRNVFLINIFNTSDYRYVFLLQSILNIFHALFIFFFIKEKKNGAPKESRGNFITNLKGITKLNAELLLFLVSLTFVTLGAIVVSKFIEVFMNDSGYDPSAIGNFVGATGIVSLLTMIFIVPVVVKLKKDFHVMILIQLLSAIIIFVVFRQTDIMVALWTGFMLYIVLKALYSPLEQHFISSFAEGEKYGSIMGVRQSFYSVGLVLGPLIGGVLYDVEPIYAFYFSSAMFIVGFILLMIVGNRLNKQEN